MISLDNIKFTLREIVGINYDYFSFWIDSHFVQFQILENRGQDDDNLIILSQEARDIHLYFQAFYILFRSAEVSTMAICNDYYDLSPFLLRYLNESDGFGEISMAKDYRHVHDIWGKVPKIIQEFENMEVVSSVARHGQRSYISQMPVKTSELFLPQMLRKNHLGKSKSRISSYFEPTYSPNKEEEKSVYDSLREIVKEINIGARSLTGVNIIRKGGEIDDFRE